MKYNSQERRAKIVEAVIAVIIVCLIAFLCYEFSRLSAIEDAAEEYEQSLRPHGVKASTPDKSDTDLPVPY